jgi:hypothetical protein
MKPFSHGPVSFRYPADWEVSAEDDVEVRYYELQKVQAEAKIAKQNADRAEEEAKRKAEDDARMKEAVRRKTEEEAKKRAADEEAKRKDEEGVTRLDLGQRVRVQFPGTERTFLASIDVDNLQVGKVDAGSDPFYAFVTGVAPGKFTVTLTAQGGSQVQLRFKVSDNN